MFPTSFICKILEDVHHKKKKKKKERRKESELKGKLRYRKQRSKVANEMPTIIVNGAPRITQLAMGYVKQGWMGSALKILEKIT